MESLHTLWINQNKITNLSAFIETVAKCFPNLKYISMMNNEAAPSYFNGGTYQEYKDYRYWGSELLTSWFHLQYVPI